jgi:hypothetical protein
MREHMQPNVPGGFARVGGGAGRRARVSSSQLLKLL